MGAFHRGMFPTLRNIFLISEPEACALYTIQDMLLKDRNTLIPVRLPPLLNVTVSQQWQGECFVLCDAGGGTVVSSKH
jgi:hypothetical protein